MPLSGLGGARCDSPHDAAIFMEVGTMLILSRKEKQRLVFTLPDKTTVEVEVVRIKGKQVTIGIVAESHVKVLRGEIAGAK
jgi:carbon storage regulator CsrA